MPAPLSDEKLAALQELIFQRRKIEAIKLYRELTGLGLRESKEEVEALEKSLEQTAPDKFAARGKGCATSAAAVLCLGLALGVCAAGVAMWFSPAS